MCTPENSNCCQNGQCEDKTKKCCGGKCNHRKMLCWLFGILLLVMVFCAGVCVGMSGYSHMRGFYDQSYGRGTMPYGKNFMQNRALYLQGAATTSAVQK